jgi:branched-chain amino acid transport system permease protein
VSESSVSTSRRPGLRGRLRAGTLVRVVIVLVLAAMPYYLSTALLQTGLFVFSAAIAAIGLNLLTGTTGQLSLGHAFFVMIGAYVYAYFSGGAGVQGGNEISGLGMPSVLALIGAVLVAGVFGLLFSPIASRLRGIYLGIASLALVFVGQHAAFNASSVTGGFYGRRVEQFDLFGFHFGDTDPYLTVLGVQFGQFERLWYLGLVLLVIAYVFATNLLRGRPGRSMEAVRDGEVAAAVIGVNVRRTKAAAFVISSMYAGLAGVLFALTVQRAVPDTFSFGLTIDYLAMIVIGGIGSVGGAVVGALVVAALPQLLTQYSDYVPFLSEPGSGGVDPGSFSRYVFGAAVVLVLLFEPRGLVAVGRRIVGRRAKGEVPGVISPPTDPVAA